MVLAPPFPGAVYAVGFGANMLAAAASTAFAGYMLYGAFHAALHGDALLAAMFVTAGLASIGVTILLWRIATFGQRTRSALFESFRMDDDGVALLGPTGVALTASWGDVSSVNLYRGPLRLFPILEVRSAARAAPFLIFPGALAVPTGSREGNVCLKPVLNFIRLQTPEKLHEIRGPLPSRDGAAL